MNENVTANENLKFLFNEREHMSLNDLVDVVMDEMLNGDSEQLKAGEDRAHECFVCYTQAVGRELFPLEEAKRACDFILFNLANIKRSKLLYLIDLYIDYNGYAINAINRCLTSVTLYSAMKGDGIYKIHSIEDFLTVKNAPPLCKKEKIRILKKHCKDLKRVTLRLKRGLKKPLFYDNRIISVTLRDMSAINAELEYYQCVPNK